MVSALAHVFPGVVSVFFVLRHSRVLLQSIVGELVCPWGVNCGKGIKKLSAHE